MRTVLKQLLLSQRKKSACFVALVVCSTAWMLLGLNTTSVYSTVGYVARAASQLITSNSPDWSVALGNKNCCAFLQRLPGNASNGWRLNSGTNKSSPADDLGQPPDCQLLVWFTTFKNVTVRQTIQNNTLKNWGKFTSFGMQPVFFTFEATRDYEETARNCGFDIYEISRVNWHGTPFLDRMVATIMNFSLYNNSVFYGFCNGDILFDESLPRTLSVIIKKISKLPAPPILVIGQRTNYKMARDWTEPETGFEHVEEFRKNGTLFRTDAIDYFFFTRDFPTHLFKDLVIGRRGYDNYIVGKALQMQVTVVDATKTLTALHQQSQNETQFAGHANPDGEHNVKTIGRFNYARGQTVYATYETVPSKDDASGIDIRPKRRRTRVRKITRH